MSQVRELLISTVNGLQRDFILSSCPSELSEEILQYVELCTQSKFGVTPTELTRQNNFNLHFYYQFIIGPETTKWLTDVSKVFVHFSFIEQFFFSF